MPTIKSSSSDWEYSSVFSLLSSDKNHSYESNENTEEYSQSEEEDFMVGMSAEQRVGYKVGHIM